MDEYYYEYDSEKNKNKDIIKNENKKSYSKYKLIEVNSKIAN
jgi:hypothetical protein